jgi:hypothetical protein
MSRKKLSEMTPMERVEQRMKGLTWEEAEDIGIEILARCLALHMFVREDLIQYTKRMNDRLFENAVKWAKSHSTELALASVVLQKNNSDEKDIHTAQQDDNL